MPWLCYLMWKSCLHQPSPICICISHIITWYSVNVTCIPIAVAYSLKLYIIFSSSLIQLEQPSKLLPIHNNTFQVKDDFSENSTSYCLPFHTAVALIGISQKRFLCFLHFLSLHAVFLVILLCMLQCTSFPLHWLSCPLRYLHNINTFLKQLFHTRPRGLMDKASDFGSED